MRLLALVRDRDHVCCRYRLRAFEPALELAGHTLEYYPFDSSWPVRSTAWRALAQADVVILQRKLLPVWQQFMLRRSAKHLIFDMDDAVFLRDSYAPRGLYSSRRWQRFRSQVHYADAVTTGNAFLASEARFAGARRVETIPTCVDPARYPLAIHARENSGVQMVWIGTSSTLVGLERFAPVLDQLGNIWLGLSLKLISNRFFHLPHLSVVPCPWSEQTEAEELASADIGVSWIPDDDWSRGKCGLKLLQYMAAGLPVVANPVGVQKSIVEDGKTGFLASTEQEWIQAVGRLVRDRQLRQRMGLAGRRRVESLYGPDAGISSWLGLLGHFHRSKQAA